MSKTSDKALMASQRSKKKDWSSKSGLKDLSLLHNYAKKKIKLKEPIPTQKIMAEQANCTPGQFRRKWDLVFRKTKLKYGADSSLSSGLVFSNFIIYMFLF